jgi:hypothetical protein
MNVMSEIQITDEILELYESRIPGALRGRFFDDASDHIVVFRGDLILENNTHLLDLILPASPGRVINAVIVDGDLTVKGCLSNYRSIKQGSDLILNDHGIHLLVMGNVQVDNLISTQGTITVIGDFTAQQAVYLFYGDGASVFGIGGQAKIPIVLVNDEHEVWFEDDGANIGLFFDLYEADYGELCEALVDEVLGAEDSKIEHKPLIEYLEINQDITRNPISC